MRARSPSAGAWSVVLALMLASTAPLASAAQPSPALQGVFGSGDPSPTADTEAGFIIFQQHCTSCHGNPAVERAPTPAQLRSMSPERIFKADAIAVEVLKRCTGEATLSDIVDDLARTFNAPREVINKDVSALLGGLADKKLLEL